MKLECKGMIVPLVTPFKENEDLDEGALRKLTNYLIGKGMHGLFPAGSTGEGWALTRDERKRIFQIVREETKGRVPIYAGTGAVCTREAIYLTKMAEDCGADAVIAITPYYIAPNQDELYEHFAAIAAATKLPVFPYNNPLRTGVNLSADTVVRLSRIDNLVGIKDSSGDLALTAQFVTRTPPGFLVCQGRDDLYFPSYVVGCVAGIPCTANVAPELALEVYEAFVAGDWDRAREAQRRLALLRVALGLGTFPAVLKEAMTMLGMSMGPARGPVNQLTKSNQAKLRQVLRDMGVLSG